MAGSHQRGKLLPAEAIYTLCVVVYQDFSYLIHTVRVSVYAGSDTCAVYCHTRCHRVCVCVCVGALSRDFTRPVASQKFPQLSIINLINMTLQIPARSLIPLAALPAVPDARWQVGMASFATVENGVSPRITVIVHMQY